MNHLILTTSLSKMNWERFRPSTLVLLLRIGFITDRSRCIKHLWKNCLLTILCRENLRCHRSISILWKREMTRWFLSQMSLRRNTIVLVVVPIVTVKIMIRLPMLILTLTPHGGTMFMEYLMDLLAIMTIFSLTLLSQLVLPCLLSHPLVCGWLS